MLPGKSTAPIVRTIATGKSAAQGTVADNSAIGVVSFISPMAMNAPQDILCNPDYYPKTLFAWGCVLFVVIGKEKHRLSM